MIAHKEFSKHGENVEKYVTAPHHTIPLPRRIFLDLRAPLAEEELVGAAALHGRSGADSVGPHGATEPRRQGVRKDGPLDSSCRGARGNGAKGYWKGITATEGLKYTIHVGITSSDSKTDKSQSTEALKKSAQNGWHANASVEGGANFGFASASVKVEGGASGSTTNDTSSEEQVA